MSTRRFILVVIAVDGSMYAYGPFSEDEAEREALDTRQIDGQLSCHVLPLVEEQP